MDNLAAVKRIELNVADAMKVAGDYFAAGDYSEAERLFRQVIEFDSSNFHAISALATALMEQGKSGDALQWLDRAGHLIRDEMITVSSNRGKALAEVGRSDEALAIFESVLRAYPGHVLSHYNLGLVRMQLGRMDDAIADLEVVLQHEPDNDKARFGRGFANLVKGNYHEGFADYEYRLKDTIIEPSVPLWDGSQDLRGKTILVHGEQGLGDNIMFARYLPMLCERAGKVLVWTPPSVRPLLRHLPVTMLNYDEISQWPEFDCWCRFMSLAHLFETSSASDIPPPVPLKFQHSEKWHQIIGQSAPMKVGLCWAGSEKSRYDAHRSVPLEELKPLFGLSGVKFYSLMKDVRPSDGAVFEELVRSGSLLSIGTYLTDFEQTANAIKCLDAVVTVDTSVAHLAGTVGVPTHIMLTAFRTYWLWIEKQTRSPWYPSVRLYRQEKDGDWSGVVRAVVNAVAGHQKPAA